MNVFRPANSVITLHNTYNTEVNCQSLFVYCDILEHVIVGDTKAPLLCSISVSGKHGDIVREIYDKPMYVPIQKKHFESIEIDIRTDFGEPVPFVNGKSLMTLHFRMSKNPYFLQWRLNSIVVTRTVTTTNSIMQTSAETGWMYSKEREDNAVMDSAVCWVDCLEVLFLWLKISANKRIANRTQCSYRRRPGQFLQRFSPETCTRRYKRLQRCTVWSVWFRQAKKTDAT